MTLLVKDLLLADRLKAERQRAGSDIYDEVWDGVYVMPPMPNDEHQQLATGLASVLQVAVGWPGLGEVRAGVNVSDLEEGWEHNYRVPDVAVFLPGGAARNCGTHWCGGPDFVVEITSPNDTTRDKFPFYGQVGVRELLLIDRDPWKLELYRLQGNELALAGEATPDQPGALASTVVPLAFRLVFGIGRPLIEATHGDGVQRWQV